VVDVEAEMGVVEEVAIQATIEEVALWRVMCLNIN